MTPEIPIDRFEIFAGGLDHPECCAFDRDGNLWAGGEAGQIYRIDPTGKVETITNVGGFCCGLAFSPDDRDLFVCVSGVGIVRVSENGEHQVFATHAGDHKIIAPNYLLFDRSGRLYVTDSGNWMKRNGFVLRFEPDGRGDVLTGPFGYANGLALSADERHLFMVESDSDSILRFEIASTSNSLLPAPCPLLTPELYSENVGRFPDGLALDADGNLYVCCYASDEIWRISPDREKMLLAHDRWGIRLGRPTNLAFGGENFDEIYVANLGRYTITRAKLGIRGQPLANLR
jgi:gluconolactonase